MTIFTVASNADSGAGSLRADLLIAKDGDIINFAPSVSLITLTTPLEIKTNVTIEGSQPTSIGSPGVVITGNSASSEFTIDAGVTTRFDGLQLSYGSSQGPNFGDSTGPAGAIDDRGILTLSNSIVDHNTGQGVFGGNVASGHAGGTGVGGIYVASGAKLNLVGSTNTFAANYGHGGNGAVGQFGQNTKTGEGYAGGDPGLGASARSGMAKTPATAGQDGIGPGYGKGGAPYQNGTDPAPGAYGSGGGGGGGNAFADYGGAGTVNVVPVCFASGTLIATTKGDVAVEHLAVGDLVVTASGERRPIRWLGHRKIDCRRHPDPSTVRPVRIAAHAFGPERPTRDLTVSPGHSICVDVAGEVLVPAIALVDNASIVQVAVEEVTYWHVELETHDILLAENLPAESYLEMGNRAFFAEAEVVSLGAGPDVPARTHADFCRPYRSDGALVDAVRARLLARSQAVGTPFGDAPRKSRSTRRAG